MFFNVPQIQYKNPWVQIMLFRNMTPSPFLRFYLGRWRRAGPRREPPGAPGERRLRGRGLAGPAGRRASALTAAGQRALYILLASCF